MVIHIMAVAVIVLITACVVLSRITAHLKADIEQMNKNLDNKQ